MTEETRIIQVTVDFQVKVPLGKAAAMLREAQDVVHSAINPNIAQIDDFELIEPDVGDIHVPVEDS